jgi:hypothetical protein
MPARGALTTTLGADLRIELAAAGDEPVRAHLTGTDSHLTLSVDRPEAFAGRGDARMVRAVADGLAERDVRIRVVSDDVHLVSIGAVHAPWWQRRFTGSPHIRIGSWRGAWTSLRSRAGETQPVLPGPEAVPPPTMLPLVPTLVPRRRVTATNAPGTGSPRLVLTRQEVWEGERQTVYGLEGDRWTIGSDPDCDVVLPGLAPVHAQVVRDQHDELLVLPVGRHVVRVHGAAVTGGQVLRTGARLELGEHTLAYVREEYADHGRPFGGRLGGEAGHQRDQPGAGAAR